MKDLCTRSLRPSNSSDVKPVSDKKNKPLAGPCRKFLNMYMPYLVRISVQDYPYHF